MKFLNNLKNIKILEKYNNNLTLKSLYIIKINSNLLNKTSIHYTTINKKIISVFTKSGKKNKIVNNLNSSFFLFYSMFFNKSINSEDLNYLFINEFKTQLYQNSKFLNIFNLFQDIIIDLKPFFYLKSSIIEKRFRKKKDEKFVYKISYIFSKNRLKKALSFFYLGFFKVKSSKLNSRFLLFLFDILLNYKKSHMYEYKVSTYKKLFLN